MTHPLPPGPHHPHNCGCHHCDEWRKHRTRAMAAERDGQLTLDDAMETP